MAENNKYSQRGSWNVSYSKDKTRDLRKKYIGPSIQTFFKDDPLKIVEGEGQYMYDENKVKYLDCINNVAHVGHSHPSVVSACAQQMSLLCTNSRFLHDNVVHLAEKISNLLPDQLEVYHFVNSGSEANDLAMRIARYYTKSKETIVLENAYHGHVTSCIKISPYKFNKPNCQEHKPDWVHVVAAPDFYRGKYRDSEYSHDELIQLYTNEVRETCQRITKEGKKLGMLFLEAMQSCGGQIIYPKEYWKIVSDIVHEYGGIVIIDEVQTGFGRVGKSFWAFQHHGSETATNNDPLKIMPDIITMGKPMGNGYPIAGVVTTRKLAEEFSKGPDYFNTYGGNPVSCAVGLAVLDVIHNEGLQKNAETVGNYLMEKLTEMKKDLSIIGDVRGAGLFIGIDLVKDRTTREPATIEAKASLYKLKKRKIIMSQDGPYDNVLKIKPPMCFSMADADFLLTNIKEVLVEISKGDLN